MYQFLTNHREELIARCKEKVARRPHRAATTKQLENGVPLFLEQLTRTLHAEEEGEMGTSLAISGASGGDRRALSEMGVGATAHGRQLLELGFSIDQVVHDYGDLCQAITDLAVEQDAPFTVDEFRTLNRCLDNSIADAVTEFSAQRDAVRDEQKNAEANERLGFLVHELRNAAGTATLAVSALERGNLPISGATGSVLKRSLAALTKLIGSSLVEVSLAAARGAQETFAVAAFLEDARQAAEMDSRAARCTLEVPQVDPLLFVAGNRDLLLAAVANLVQNAFKFTRQDSKVTLRAYANKDRVFLDVEDQCGGLRPGSAETIFAPFSQRSEDRSGLGLGLSIARASVEADGGTLSVRDLPGTGCVFTVSLPKRGAPQAPEL
jgi:signal transduction histidine kinase